MIVAAIAWKNLDAASRARTSQLLRLNPDYAKWIADIAPDRRDEIAFVTASTWPDAIKRDPGYIFDGDAPSDPAAAQNIGYGDHYQHRYWHYIDVPFSMDGTPLVQPATPNAEILSSSATTSSGVPMTGNIPANMPGNLRGRTPDRVAARVRS